MGGNFLKSRRVSHTFHARELFSSINIKRIGEYRFAVVYLGAEVTPKLTQHVKRGCDC